MNSFEMLAVARSRAMSEALFAQNFDKALKVMQLKAFISKVGGPLGSFYVGITKNVPQRLSEHKVYVYHQYEFLDCGSHLVAREIEDLFLGMGLEGGDGGGNDQSTFVYIYKMDLFTEPGYLY